MDQRVKTFCDKVARVDGQSRVRSLDFCIEW